MQDPGEKGKTSMSSQASAETLTARIERPAMNLVVIAYLVIGAVVWNSKSLALVGSAGRRMGRGRLARPGSHLRSLCVH